MLTNPKAGTEARIWYREEMRQLMPFHGQVCTIKGAGYGKPRNHVVEVEGVRIVLPCGNLKKLNEST